MKKIAFISEHASPLALIGGIDNGGQNVYVAELSKALAASGHVVDIYTRRESPLQPEVVNWMPGVRVVHIKAGPEIPVEKEVLLDHMEEFTQNMLLFLSRTQWVYELIHAHFFMSAMVASAIKKILHTPYVVTFHALGLVRKAYQKEADRFPPERCDIERFIVRDADHLIAECPQDREDLLYYYGADPEKISLAPCGFNPKEFYPQDRQAARKKLGLSSDSPILLQLGRMVPRKGVDTVIRAMELLRHRIGKVYLLIVGGNTDEPDPVLTPEIGRLQQIARELNVSDQILFAGRKCREKLRDYYAAADIFITTPWYEPFGITPLEAMACGLPVIGSDTGGIKYSVIHERTGYLVPANDPQTLALKTGALLTNKRLCRQMGKNGLKRVHKFFTWEKVAEKVACIYACVEADLRRERIMRRMPFDKELTSLRTAGALFKQPFYPEIL